MHPYTADIISSIEPKVRATLNDEQIKGIRDALASRKHGIFHLVDVSGTIPLYFASYYFVFQFGRDRRMGHRRVEHQRRRKARLLGNVLFFVIVVFPLVLLALAGLYFLKMALGIDLFPGVHLPNLLGLGR